MIRYHELKIVQKYYEDVISGAKKAELRKNDRCFNVGDIIVLREIDVKDGDVFYTSRYAYVVISHILTDRQFGGLEDGYCIISFDYLYCNTEVEQCLDNTL